MQRIQARVTGVPRGVSARRQIKARADAKANQKLMWEAIREAIDEEMEADPTVCVMGEDVGHYGGSYKVR